MRKGKKFTLLVTILCSLALLVSLLAFEPVAASASADDTASNKVTATTTTTVKQGDTVNCYVYIDSLESLSSLNVAVHFDPDKISVTSSFNSVSCALYDSSINESYVQFSYIFDGNGGNTKTQLFYFQYKVLTNAEEGTAHFDIVVSEAYDSSLNIANISGSRCPFTIAKKVTSKNCTVSGTSPIKTAIEEEFELSYRLNTTGVASGSFVIRYDAELFEFVDLSVGDLLKNKFYDIKTDQPGVIYVSFVGTEYANSSQLLSVKFKTIKNATQNSQIKLSVTDFYDLELNSIGCSGYTTTVNLEYDPTYSNDAPTMTVSTIYSAEKQQVTVVIKLAAGSYLGAGDFVLNFNTEYFTYNSATKGFVPTFFNINDKKANEGVIKFSIISMADIMTEETVLTVIFDTPVYCNDVITDFDIGGSGLADSLTNPILINFVDSTLSISGVGHDLISHPAQAPTCTEIGWYAYATCSRCDYTTYEEIPANGHSYVHTLCSVCEDKQPVYKSWDVSVASDGSVMANLYQNVIDGGYELEIAGCGAMKDWASSSYVPWYNAYRSQINYLIIENGITYIGERAFSGLTALTSITLPNNVETVGDYSFYGCTNLSSIAFGNSVKTIGDYAFYGCTSLASVALSDSVEVIEGYAFYNCTSLSNLSLGTSVTTIGTYAFGNCSALTSITIPESVTSIRTSAFANCYLLNEINFNASAMNNLENNNNVFFNAGINGEGIAVTIGANVTKIPAYLFYPTFNGTSYLPKVTSVTFANGSICESIGAYVFYYADELVSINLPASVETIGTYAFAYCSALKSVSIPASVTDVGVYAFYGCTALTEIEFNAIAMNDLTSSNYVFYNAGVNGEGIAVTVGSGVTKIPAYLFYPYNSSYCPNIISVTFVNGSVCESIGAYAFYYADEITCISLPDTVETIGSNAFYYCTALESVDLGDSVITIGSSAFYNCYALTSITIPESVTTIGGSVFYNCKALTEIIFNGANMADLSNNNYVFYNAGVDGDGISVQVGKNVAKIPAYLFYATSYNTSCLPKITSVDFEDDSICKTIGNFAFAYSKNIVEIVLPDGVEAIGEYAFYTCTNLLRVKIPSSVTSIGYYGFNNCPNIIFAFGGEALPASLGSGWKNSDTLYHLNAERFVVVNDALYIIFNDETAAFAKYYGSDSEYTILDQVDNIPVVLIGKNAFRSNTALQKIVIPDTVTKIDEYVFYYCSALSEVEIGASVKAIGTYAFAYCSALSKIHISDSVENIGTYAFYNCTSLESVYIGSAITTIGSSAFYNCTALTSIEFNATALNDFVSNNSVFYNAGVNGEGITVTVGSGVTKIPEYLFYSTTNNTSYLPKITNVIFENNSACESIGNYAFYYADELASINLPASIETIGTSAFYNCYTLTSITIPESVTTIGGSAFSNCKALTEIIFNASNMADLSNNNYVFYNAGVDGDGISVQVGKNVAKIPAYLFYATSNNTSYNPKITSVVFEENSVCESIGMYAFYKSQKLSEILFPEGLEVIESYAFCYCSNLLRVTIPDTVYRIDSYAFYGCSKIVIGFYADLFPATVGSSWYSGDWVYYLNIDQFVIWEDALYVTFDDNTATLAKYYGSASEYQILDVIDGKNVTTIGKKAFANNATVVNVTMPDSIVTFGESAFYYCTLLESITLSENLDSIGNYAFYGCSVLTTILIPESVTSIGKSAFSGCSALESIVIPESVTTIGSYAFYNCESLVNVQMPSFLTTIGDYAFYYCKALTEIVIPETVITIGDSAFLGSGLKTVYIHNAQIAQNANNETFYGYLLKGSVVTIVIPSDITNVSYYIRNNYTNIEHVTYDNVSYKVYSKHLHSWEYNDLIYDYIACEQDKCERYGCQYCGAIKDVITFKHDVIVHGAKEPDCTNVGWYEYQTCSRCDYTTYMEIPALGHRIEEDHREWVDSYEIVENISGASSQYTFQKIDGIYTSTNKQDSTESHFSITAQEYVPVLISYRVSSEYGCDVFRIYQNDWLIAEISGEEGWYSQWVYLNYGDQLSFYYTKDGSVNNGEDAAYFELYFEYDYANYCFDQGYSFEMVDGNYFSTNTEDNTSSIIKIQFSSYSYVQIQYYLSCEYGDEFIVYLNDNQYFCGYGADDWGWLDMYVYEGDVLTFIYQKDEYGSGYNDRVQFSIYSDSEYAVLSNNQTFSFEYNDGVYRPGQTPADSISILTFNVLQDSEFYFDAYIYGYTSEFAVYVNDWNCFNCQDGGISGSVCVNSGDVVKIVFYDYSSEDNDAWFTFSCRAEIGEIEVFPADNYQPTCTEAVICSICNGVAKEALGHDEIAHDAKAPACTEFGWDAYVTCSRCDHSTYEEISALGHEGEHFEAKDPTCTEHGWLNYMICSRCGYTNYSELTALGHRVLVDGKILVESIETNNESAYPFIERMGYYCSSNTAHNSDSYFTITAQYDCTLYLHFAVSSERNCDKLIVRRNGSYVFEASGEVAWTSRTITLSAGDVLTINYHKDGSVSSFEDKICFYLVCDKTEIDALVPMPAEEAGPTCTDAVACHFCQALIKEALGHDEIHHSGQAPTCTEIGWDAYDTCSRCDYTTYVEIPANGHSYNEWEVILAPTCTEIGTERRDCEVCDHYETRDVVALGHDEINHDAQAPTCTEIGWYAYVTCSRCEYTTYVEIAALGHDEISHSAKEPTCTTIGWYDYVTCSRCDYTTYVEKAVLGHDTINHEAQAPTCTEIGWYAYDTCSRCSHTTYREIPATGHNYVRTICSNCGEAQPIFKTWDISADGSGTLIANLYRNYVEGGYELVITGIGAMAEYSFSSAPWYNYGNSITRVEFSDGITTIGSYAFCYCTALRQISIPENIEKISSNAFAYAEKLIVIFEGDELPNTLVSGWDGASSYFLDPQKVVITEEATYVIDADGNAWLAKYVGNAKEFAAWDSVDGIPVTKIAQYAFYKRSNLQTYWISEEITYIGRSAFESCGSLAILFENSNLPAYTGSSWNGGCSYYLGAETWVENEFLFVHDINNRVDLICYQGTEQEITIPAQPGGYPLLSIRNYAFYQSKVKHVIIPEGIQSIGDNAFYGCSSLQTIQLPQSLLTIGNNAFYNCYSLLDVVLPENLTSIGQYAFWYCTSIKSIIIPQNVTKLSGTFVRCSALENVILHDGITHLESMIFYGCTSLKEIQLPKNLKYLGSSAFYDCKNLKVLEIPENVHSVSWSSAFGSTSLDVIYICSSRLAASLTESILSDSSFKGIKTIVVPAGTGTEYLQSVFLYCETIYRDGVAYDVYSLNAHSWQQEVIEEFAICQNDGVILYTCENCGVEKLEITLCHDKVYHDAKAPNCTEIGWHAYETCSRCDYTTYVEIAANGHSYGEWVEILAPTCTALGTDRRDCDNCDHYETRDIAALGHDEVPHDAKAVTCTAIGWNAYVTCTRCDYTTYAEIPATGHSYGEWVETLAPACLTKGSERRDCENCDHYETREVAALGHNEVNHDAKAVTCTAIGWNAYVTCTRCDYTTYVEIPATGHTSSDWIIDEEATYEADGSKHKECTVCHEVLETSTIPMLTHSYVSVITAPTCTEQGYTTHICSDCGNSYVDDYVPATGHNYGAWVQTLAPKCEIVGTERRDCSVCDHYETRDIVATGHTASDWIVDSDATCTTDGSKHKECTVCGKILETYTLTKLGHNEIGHSAKAPTCTKIGWNTYVTCSRCDYTTYAEIPANGHNYGIWISEIPASCEGEGTLGHYHCSACSTDFDANKNILATLVISANGHTESDWIVDVEPICTAEGSKHKECTVCEKVLSTDSIEMLGHNTTTFSAKAPTCTAIGWEAYETCSRCSYSTYVELPANGHNYGNWIAEIPATCEGEGTLGHYHCSACSLDFDIEKNILSYLVISATGHTASEWIADSDATCTTDGSKHKECTVCGKTLETYTLTKLGHDEIGHSAKAPTCTAIGWNAYVTCSRCDYSTYAEIPATGHSYGDWEVILDPTCTVHGTERRDCDNCDHYETRDVDALGHSEITHGAKTPTCTEIGWDAYVTCSRCDYTTYQELPATGHKCGEWKEKYAPTCTKEGKDIKKCSNCDYYETRDVAALGHNIVSHKAKAVTCTEIGWNEYVACTKCSYTTYLEIPATGHKAGDWIIDEETSCEADGSMHKECLVCREVFETTTIPMIAHSYAIVVTDPTCTAQGYTTYICGDCGKTYVDEYTPAAGHYYDEWIIKTPPTCTTGGQETRICRNCDHCETRDIESYGHDAILHPSQPSTCTEIGWNAYETCLRCDHTTYAEIPANGHAYGEWQEMAEPTCTENGKKVRGCAVCLIEEIEIIEKFGHDEVHYDAQNVSCTQIGWDTYVACSRCDYTTYVEIPKLEHIMGEWECSIEPSCTEKGEERRICANCDYSEIRELPALNHDRIEHEAKVPTCTEIGYDAYVSCSRCDYSTYVELPSNGGHMFGEWVQIVAPGSGTMGQERRDCENCDHYETKDIAALGYLQAFVDAVASLSKDQSAEATYNELYTALQFYSKLTDEEKEDANDAFIVLQAAIESYNAKANVVNEEMEKATEVAFVPISTNFVFLAALWLLLKKKFWIK